MTGQVVRDLDEATYHKHPALSATAAKNLLSPSCPAIFRYQQDNPQPSTPVFDLGAVVHKILLGEGQEIVIVELDDWRTKIARAQRDRAHAEGKLPLLRKEYLIAEAMAASAFAHPVAGKLLRHPDALKEASLFWHDDEFNIDCRGRVDYLLPYDGKHKAILIDVKTAASSEPTEVARSLSTYSYHMQLAYYAAGIRAVGLDGGYPVVCFLLVIGKSEPFVTTLYQPDSQTLDVGKAMCREAWAVYSNCVSTGRWPGFSDGVLPLQLPAWG